MDWALSIPDRPAGEAGTPDVSALVAVLEQNPVCFVQSTVPAVGLAALTQQLFIFPPLTSLWFRLVCLVLL